MSVVKSKKHRPGNELHLLRSNRSKPLFDRGICTEQEMERLRRRLIKLVWDPKSSTGTSTHSPFCSGSLVRVLAPRCPATFLLFAAPSCFAEAQPFMPVRPPARTGGAPLPPICKCQSRRGGFNRCSCPIDRSPQFDNKVTRHEAEPASSRTRVISWEIIVPHTLVFGWTNWIQTMMQIYASAAKLRSSGAHSLIRHEGHV
jgi:hypothetical protein